MIADHGSAARDTPRCVAAQKPLFARASTIGRRMTTIERSTWTTKVGLARMLAGGVIMDVVTADQAKIAEEAGAVIW